MKTKKINGREIAKSGFTRHLEKVFPSKPTQKECPECRTVSLDGSYHRIDCSFFKKEPNHTAKWKVDGNFIVTDKGSIICDMTPAGPNGDDKANAAFIVRACNAHKELLEAAKNAGNVLAGLINGDLSTLKKDSYALAFLRQAIAKAEGRP